METIRKRFRYVKNTLDRDFSEIRETIRNSFRSFKKIDLSDYDITFVSTSDTDTYKVLGIEVTDTDLFVTYQNGNDIFTDDLGMFSMDEIYQIFNSLQD